MGEQFIVDRNGHMQNLRHVRWIGVKKNNMPVIPGLPLPFPWILAFAHADEDEARGVLNNYDRKATAYADLALIMEAVQRGDTFIDCTESQPAPERIKELEGTLGRVLDLIEEGGPWAGQEALELRHDNDEDDDPDDLFPDPPPGMTWDEEERGYPLETALAELDATSARWNLTVGLAGVILKNDEEWDKIKAVLAQRSPCPVPGFPQQPPMPVKKE